MLVGVKWFNNIARNLQQQDHIAKLQTTSIVHQNENNSSINLPQADFGDPMDLSRMKLSSAERKYRLENGLCVACGEKGHYSKDHHRKFDPIPMPKRGTNQSMPGGPNNQLQPVAPDRKSTRLNSSHAD